MSHIPIRHVPQHHPGRSAANIPSSKKSAGTAMAVVPPKQQEDEAPLQGMFITPAKQRPIPAPWTAKPVQRVIYNMGDDKALADKDGPKLSRKLKQHYEEMPIPKMENRDSLFRVEENPITIMLHGSTLKAKGPTAFGKLLIEKGMSRINHQDMVLISCGAANVLTRNGQALANELQMNIYAADGIVSVREDGIPVVRVKRKEGPDDVSAEDIYKAIREEVKTAVKGWQKFVPQPEASKKIIADKALALKATAGTLQERMARLEKVKEILGDLTELDIAKENLGYHTRDVGRIIEQIGTANEETSKDMHDRTVELSGDLEHVENKINRYEEAYKAKTGFSINLAMLDEVEDTGGGGWGDDDHFLDEAETDTAIHTPVTGNNVTQVKSIVQRAPVIQRVVTGATQTALNKTLAQIADTFQDIHLVKGQGLDLTIGFSSALGSSYGRTRLEVDNNAVIPADYLVPVNANKHYTIVIYLNELVYGNGLKADAMGSMVETLVHEWELHGRQHATNVTALKQSRPPALKIDHEELFKDAPIDMDSGIANQINLPGHEHIQADIYHSYINDIIAHQEIIAKGWTKEENDKGNKLYLALQQLNSLYQQSTKEKDPAENIEAFKDYCSWDMEKFLALKPPYEGMEALAPLENYGDFAIDALKSIQGLAFNDADGIYFMVPEYVKELLPLMEDLFTVLKVSKLQAPAAARKLALKGLGIPVDTFDAAPSGQQQGIDNGVDFTAANKKRD